MRKKLLLVAIVVLATASLLLTYSASMAQAQKPKIAPPCKQCHAPDEKTLMGTMVGVSDRAETIQIQIGPASWIVKYDDNTKVKGISELEKIPKEKEIAITLTERDGILYAAYVAVKQPATLPDEKKIKIDELSRLIETQGDFVLIDSRPAPKFHEGHIPGAISIYDAEFEKNIDKLPKEKDKLLIFYCAGPT